MRVIINEDQIASTAAATWRVVAFFLPDQTPCLVDIEL